MPIGIAGMHRSATSMAARLLNVCGVYLGLKNDLAAAAFDNEAGFWENLHSVKLNDDILAQLGGGWDLPPVLTEGWESQEKLAGLRGDATKLIKQFGSHKLWGWKDPRNSITFPFWRQLLPDLKVVVCLRNPMEVAQSLHKRSHASKAFGLNLWLLYHQQLLASTQPSERIITHYDAYFYDPQAELQ
jgi:hypothetical protein